MPRWNALDALVSHAKSLGLHVELTLTGAPDWATGATGTGVPPQPAFYGRYAKFLGDLAQRLGPKVDAWAAWNEPNHPNYWSTPDPVAFAHLQQAAYPAIKAADPSSTVLLAPIAPTGPGCTGTPGSGSINPYNYLQSLYDNGIRGYYDAIAWNLYPPGAPEDAFPDSCGQAVRRIVPGPALRPQPDPGQRPREACLDHRVRLVDLQRLPAEPDQRHRRGDAGGLPLARLDVRTALPAVGRRDVLVRGQRRQLAVDVGARARTDPERRQPQAVVPGADRRREPERRLLGRRRRRRHRDDGGGGSGGGGGSKPPKAKVCTVPSVVRSKGKVVLNVGVFTPKPHLGFFNLSFAVVTKSKKTAVVVDGQRGAKWLSVTTVKLKQSSKLRLKVRDRGYTMIRVRANSVLGHACRSRAPVVPKR